MSWYSYYPRSSPVETDQGIKAKSKRGDFVKNWWATRWIKAMEQVMDRGRLQRGRRYARQGQVLSLTESKSGVVAKVQGSRSRPYKITITLTPLSDKKWEAVLDALAQRAIFTAQLLAGEMPKNIEEAFKAASASLFPSSSKGLKTNCSCPDYASVCKHLAAVHYILAERFDEDPFLLFRLRGRTQEQILEGLRKRRGGAEEEDGIELPEYEPAPPLHESLDHFWRLGQLGSGGGSLDHFATRIKPPVTPLPVLKRLGQPSFMDDQLTDLLKPAYSAISQAAIEAAFGETK
ncbi:MAG: hypothetical protein ACPGWR_12205 [Ardenticatenaceae bacterium]